MELILLNTTEIVNMKGAFADFKGMAEGYAEKENADSKTSFILGMICAMSQSESISFMEYILEYWNAYAMDILSKKYQYVKLTEMVYESWKTKAK